MHDTADMPRNLLSCLWAGVALNIAFADILSIYVPGVLPQIMAGTVEGVPLSPGLVLVGAVFLQVPVAMVAVSQWLGPAALRRATLVAAGVTTVFVVGGGSIKPHYLFLAACEVAAMAAAYRLVMQPPRGPGNMGAPTRFRPL